MSGIFIAKSLVFNRRRVFCKVGMLTMLQLDWEIVPFVSSVNRFTGVIFLFCFLRLKDTILIGCAYNELSRRTDE